MKPIPMRMCCVLSLMTIFFSSACDDRVGEERVKPDRSKILITLDDGTELNGARANVEAREPHGDVESSYVVSLSGQSSATTSGVSSLGLTVKIPSTHEELVGEYEVGGILDENVAVSAIVDDVNWASKSGIIVLEQVGNGAIIGEFSVVAQRTDGHSTTDGTHDLLTLTGEFHGDLSVVCLVVALQDQDEDGPGQSDGEGDDVQYRVDHDFDSSFCNRMRTSYEGP